MELKYITNTVRPQDKLFKSHLYGIEIFDAKSRKQ